MRDEEIDVYALLQNSTQDEVQSDTVHIMSNLNLNDFMSVSQDKTLRIEGENKDTLQLSKEDGWIETEHLNDDGYSILSNTQDSQIELLIKGIEVDIC